MRDQNSTAAGEAAFTNADPFVNINDKSAEEIDRIAGILELRGSQPRQIKMRQACFAAAGLGKAMSVLDLGCGTGVSTRDIARMVGRSGRIVGVDKCPGLLGHARTRDVIGVPVEYVVGDINLLDFPDETFDATACIMVLSHLADHQRALSEIFRVTRHTIMLLDHDYQTLVYDHSDTKLTRKILLHGADYRLIDGWCGRKVPGLLVGFGAQKVQCWPFVYSERDTHSFLFYFAEQLAAQAADQNVVGKDEAKAWLQELEQRGKDGTFFASLNYYFAFGTKP